MKITIYGWSISPKGADEVAMDLGQQVVQARQGVQVRVARPAAIAIGQCSVQLPWS
jgi:hypothetical protein